MNVELTHPNLYILRRQQNKGKELAQLFRYSFGPAYMKTGYSPRRYVIKAVKKASADTHEED